MKKIKYLSLYKRWMKAGYIPCYGLCKTGIDVSLFEPTNQDSKEYARKLGYSPDLFDTVYWGADHEDSRRFNEFGPTRQNIVLLLAAMNNEL